MISNADNAEPCPAMTMRSIMSQQCEAGEGGAVSPGGQQGALKTKRWD